MSITDLLSQLNNAQQKAVLETDGPLLILAGAGSGKTRVLTYKVAYLISEKKIPPQNILMVTFTNKAAKEMKSRIETLLNSSTTNHELRTANQQLPFAGTFHALCAKILRVEGRFIGLSPQFVIYDTNDQKELIRQAMVELDISQKQNHPAAVHAMISQAKNELITPKQYDQYARGPFQKIVAAVYHRYQFLLKENSAVDFDDLMLITVELFQTNPQILEKYARQYRYVLVDEYQDTNSAQYTLTKLLASHWHNICVVGDASQSIYSWRGANFRNIVRFQSDFANAKTINLEQNYRSTQTILDAAFAVISKNTSHPILKLWTDNEAGDKISLVEARNEQTEALGILAQIEKNNFKLSETAILYRTNAQSRVIEEILLHYGIPYTVVGGVNFYERKEVKDILSYLRLINNPNDSVAYRRAEKIGKKRLQAFEKLDKLQTAPLPTGEILEKILQASGYLDQFNQDNEEDLARVENIKELRSVAEQFPTLTGFLENVALVEAAYKPRKFADREGLTLMTLHGAKGLEFEQVFMIGMEEGLFPHSRSLMDSEELEEERRLCYVGITRAKRHLYLSYTRSRMFFGSRTSNVVSRFLSEIPESLLKTEVKMSEPDITDQW